MTGFIILAAILVILALALLLPPLLRSGASLNKEARLIRQRLRQIDSDLESGLIGKKAAESLRQDLSARLLARVSNSPQAEGPGRATVMAIAMLIAVPALTLWIYLKIGLPEAVDLKFDRAPATTAGQTEAGQSESSGDAAPSLEQALAGLQARLKQQPDDVEGWVLLGRSYMQLGQHAQAADAFERADSLAPNEPWILVDWVEAQFMASGEPRISDAGVAMLQRAVSIDPSHQKGTWMLGIAAYQAGDFATAVEHFEHLESMLEPGSAVAETLIEQIDDARFRAGMPVVGTELPAAEEPSGPVSDPPPGDGPRLTVEVSLDPALADRVGPNDVLFIFARAAQGPPMPLAVQRLAAGSLPATVILDKSMGMTEQFTLASFPSVVVGARISKSGNATPQAGDLQVFSAPVSNNHTEIISLTINTVVEP